MNWSLLAFIAWFILTIVDVIFWTAAINKVSYDEWLTNGWWRFIPGAGIYLYYKYKQPWL